MFVHGDSVTTATAEDTPADGTADVPGDSLLVVLCGDVVDTTVTLPPPPWGSSYLLLWDSADVVPTEPEHGVEGTQYVRARSLRLYGVDRTPASPASP